MGGRPWSLSWLRAGPWQAIKVWRLRVVTQIDLLSHQPEGAFLDVTMLLRRLPCSDPANEPRSSAQPGYSHLLTGARQDYLPERTRPAWCHALLECLEVAVSRFDGPMVWARPELNTLVKLAAERRQNFTRPQQEVRRATSHCSTSHAPSRHGALVPNTRQPSARGPLGQSRLCDPRGMRAGDRQLGEPAHCAPSDQTTGVRQASPKQARAIGLSDGRDGKLRDRQDVSPRARHTYFICSYFIFTKCSLRGEELSIPPPRQRDKVPCCRRINVEQDLPRGQLAP